MTKAPFKAAEQRSPPPAAPPADIDWQDMKTVPRDRTVIRLTADLERAVPAVWKRTRRFEGGRWAIEGYWIDPMTKAKVEIEPVGWAAAEKVVA